MKVLVVAPQPFYQERGTPIAVDMLVGALSDRGDDVDLLTFHEGQDREHANVRIVRIPAVPGLSGVRPGISFKKIVCDVLLFFRMMFMVGKNRYDVVHAVEESSFMAMITRLFTRTPYIVDMDSLMSVQIVDRFSFMKPAESMMKWLEFLPVRYATLVVPMCDRFAEEARRYRNKKDIIVLRDVTLVHDDGAGAVDSLRDELNIDGFVLMYIGNLEPYQGIDLLLSAFELAFAADPDLRLVIIGGRSDDIQKYQAMVSGSKIRDAVYLVGPRGVKDIGGYMSQADVLVSPRIRGVNTPMKIYSYLDSGVPLLATNLLTHTQVLNDDIALLVEPDKESFASGIQQLKSDNDLRVRLARDAKEYANREHSYEKFKETVNSIYMKMESRIGGKPRNGQ